MFRSRTKTVKLGSKPNKVDLELSHRSENKNNDSANILSDPERKMAANDFLMAFKIKALDELVEQKSYGLVLQIDEEKDEDVYLDKAQKAYLMKTKCLLRSHSKFKTNWDLLIMIMCIFN